MLIDSAKITIKAGDGGDGVIGFRREKYVPKGGPDGGDGGKGGDIYVQADRNLTTLMDFRYKQYYKAESGRKGQGSRKTGLSGDDFILKVPVGTLIKDFETDEVLCDLIHDGEKVCLAKGGKGGLGNQHFATPSNRAPRHATKGEVGEEKTIQLELKMLADVGLVGFPNAGKSTLISKLSAARPKIADYPFTTLEPNLGIVHHKDYQTFVIADIPGIIEGASEGKGLGIKFLKHIERTKILALLIPATTEKIKNEYETLLNELEHYNPQMLEKPRVLVITKIDSKPQKFKVPKIKGVKIHSISSITGEGLDDLIDIFWQQIQIKKSKEEQESLSYVSETREDAFELSLNQSNFKKKI
ncbi:MAG: GTPase ObgE [Chloroherpetonaceae bacterium]|nr:GTPase ObgE [Chloroherpetonaceae bacterium]